MIHRFKDINIYYETYGNGKEYVLFLHGFGGNTQSFGVFYDKMLKDKTIINLDFPPFGKSENIKEVFTIETYTDLVKSLVDFLGIKKLSIVCHSFGGRVAILFASRYNDIVEKMVFVDTAGIKPRFSLIKEIKICIYKIKKKLKLNIENQGSKDYQSLDKIMKQSFVKIVNFDETKYLSLITCPVLIIWGEKDKETPLYMAKKLNKKIKDSALIVFKKAGHFSHYDNFNGFIKIVDNFLKG